MWQIQILHSFIVLTVEFIWCIVVAMVEKKLWRKKFSMDYYFEIVNVM